MEVLLTCELDFIANVSTLSDIKDAHSLGIVHVARERTTDDGVTVTPQVNEVWPNVLRDEREQMTLRLSNILNSQIALKWIYSNIHYTGFLHTKAQNIQISRN